MARRRATPSVPWSEQLERRLGEPMPRYRSAAGSAKAQRAGARPASRKGEGVRREQGLRASLAPARARYPPPLGGALIHVAHGVARSRVQTGRWRLWGRIPRSISCPYVRRARRSRSAVSVCATQGNGPDDDRGAVARSFRAGRSGAVSRPTRLGPFMGGPGVETGGRPRAGGCGASPPGVTLRRARWRSHRPRTGPCSRGPAARRNRG
ncbi:hypothetical protein BH10PSE4_BH10PSE4_33260 [soil metagenome]